ncbi:MAG: MBL fold metallo-hydrolase, partial [FCB group bacterium]|nr:MBL fold metallo-hydrolase [FCB group bacterium]
TIEDAQKAIKLLKGIPYDTTFQAAPGIRVSFLDAGHILGSSFVVAEWKERERDRKIVFSGDLGRYKRPILKDPTTVDHADYLLIESTYGDRLHEEKDPGEELKRIILQTVGRKGVVLIPAFAVGRTQELLYRIRELEDAGAIPVLPVYVDSPMAIRATKLYERYSEFYDKKASLLHEKGTDILQTTRMEFTESVEDSKRINALDEPCIIISASGMLTGGRILHHLIQRLPRTKNTIVFVGYQAEGTRGRALQSGKDTIKIHGMQIKAAARIETISDLSAHADYNEILSWMSRYETAPSRTFIVHGEPDASRALQERIEDTLGWDCYIPEYEETVTLE